MIRSSAASWPVASSCGRRLGAGSMGTVYRARQEAVARDVALKILRSDRAIDALARQRFVREAKAMSLLASPHTVTVFDFGEMTEPGADPDFGDGGVSLFLAMELLDGEALGDCVKRLGRVPWVEAVAIVRQALLSLAEAHEKGVIHRDLKPDNLFLAKSANGGEIVKSSILASPRCSPTSRRWSTRSRRRPGRSSGRRATCRRSRRRVGLSTRGAIPTRSGSSSSRCSSAALPSSTTTPSS